MRRFLPALILICGTTVVGFAQDVTVNRSNRTVEVTVTATIEVEAEVAVLSLGHTDYGRTSDAAFADNVRAADRILQALGQAGVPKGSIETLGFRVDRAEPNERWTIEERAERQFVAIQSWEVRVGVTDAQRVLDAAVRAGANEVTDVEWHVKDADALDAKATAAALEKAEGLARQIADGLGGKLGELVYASNTERKPKGLVVETENMVAPPPPGSPQLKLLPRKVEQEATVHAIFAID